MNELINQSINQSISQKINLVLYAERMSRLDGLVEAFFLPCRYIYSHILRNRSGVKSGFKLSS